RVSRIRGDIRFATRRERDFRMPEDFEPAEYRGQQDWQFRDPVGEATIELDADTAWWVERMIDRGSVEDGVFTTEYAELGQLAGWVLRQEGRARPVSPPELVDLVRAGIDKVIETHEGEATKPPRAAASRQEAGPLDGPPAAAAPERFGVLQALLAFLLASCGNATSARISA